MISIKPGFKIKEPKNKKNLVIGDNGFLPSVTYKKIFAVIPIVCVDVVVKHKNKALLCKRTNKPGQGKLFLPGGRVFKNEYLKKAVVRKTFEELGIRAKQSDFKFLTISEGIFKGSQIGGSMHNINTVYLIEFKKKPVINFDKTQTSKIVWVRKINDKLHPSVKRSLKAAGLK
ncbi:MAG: NUDIX domain-containing protein [Patescibacteria group bacterium]|nr:NUDIX domain-containing protein [Patescibacteria group bacterium]